MTTPEAPPLLVPAPCVRRAPAAAARCLRAWRGAVALGFAVLGVALLFGRVPLPDGLAFGYRSCARNVALLYLVGALAGAPGLGLARSRVGAGLLLFAAVATASVLQAGGRPSAVSPLWTAAGVFFAARALAAEPRVRRLLLHGLGVLCVAILARELWHQPALPWLREARRLTLVTEHPNTLGFMAALATPLLVGATATARARGLRVAYAVASAGVLLATFSRAAWLALGAATFLVALVVRARRRPVVWRLPLAAAALLAIVVAVACLSPGRAEADAQRLRIVATSWSLFLDRWPLGVGFGSGNLERAFPARYLERNGESVFLFHSHDLYVDVLTGTGLAGALAALLLFASLIGAARRALAHAQSAEEHALALGHATSLGVFFIAGLFDTPLYHGRLLLLATVAWAMMDAAATSRAPDRVRSPIAGAQESGTRTVTRPPESPS